MTKTTNHEDLSEGIERLVREYISTIHITAQAAVKRAIAAGVASDGVAKVKHVRAPAASGPGRRRASNEIGTLSERLYEVVVPDARRDDDRPGACGGRDLPGAASADDTSQASGPSPQRRTRHATRYFPSARDAQRGSA